MPQIGQLPGESRITCGCIGQVYEVRGKPTLAVVPERPAAPSPTAEASCVQCSVLMPVMHVGVMRMSVHERLVGVLVRMRLAPIPVEVVPMLMVSVVAMRMRVRQSFVNMLVLMHLGEV